jgi:Putative DNA-binding domain
MCKVSCRETPVPMLPEGREGNFRGEPSYAAVFSRALLNPDLATPTMIAGPKSKAAVKRYNVYRNNVTGSLINALAAAFPATLRITGLVTRPALEVKVRRLPPGGAIFLSRLMTGESLGAAASAAFSESLSFDLPANIRGLLEAGAFTTVLCGES